MDEIKRYMIPWTGKLIEKDDGDYVLHSDHEAAIRAAVAAERAECAGIAAFYAKPGTPTVQRVIANQIAESIMSRGAAHE